LIDAMQTIKNKFIAVEGVIGVGKTTLAKKLAEQFNARLLLEVVEENPFLQTFYEDIAGKAFQTQIFFLLSRYRQASQSANWRIEMFNTNIISDYMFMKDKIFAQLTLNDTELNMYNTIFNILKERVVLPNLVIYLYADLDTIIARIRNRNRQFEKNIQPEYIYNLMLAYDKFFSTSTEYPVIKLDTNGIDFTQSSKQFDTLTDEIKKVLQRV